MGEKGQQDQRTAEIVSTPDSRNGDSNGGRSLRGQGGIEQALQQHPPNAHAHATRINDVWSTGESGHNANSCNGHAKSESKVELAQQLLDHLLGQYFKKSDTFRALLFAARRSDVTTDVV